MRFYPNGDPYIYSDLPNNWNLYCQQPHLNWHRPTTQAKHSINYWRDIELSKMERILYKDLCMKNWSKSRIRPGACLPIYYGTGIERPNFYDAKKPTKLLNVED